MKALVLHPRFELYGGGENLCLHVIKALQEDGYRVFLACDEFRPDKVGEMFNMARVMAQSEWIPLPKFNPMIPRFLAYQRLLFAARVMDRLRKLNPDIVFSTYPAPYYVPSKPTYHILYDMGDLSVITWSNNLKNSYLGSPLKIPYYAAARLAVRNFGYADFRNRIFIPLSHSLENELHRAGFPITNVIYPPCPEILPPLPKKKQVVQMTRVVPEKRLEEFLDIARKLPDYPFYIIARESIIHPGYLQSLVKRASDNVHWIENPIRKVPRYLQESKVYLYTSQESGVNISTVQAMLAGCIPVCPSVGGGSEIVTFSGTGRTFKNTDEAVEAIRVCMDATYSPEELAERAKIFSAQAFEENIKKVISGSVYLGPRASARPRDRINE